MPRCARLNVPGTHAEIARTLKANSVNVSTWYGKAVRNLPVLQPVIDDVLRTQPAAPPIAPWQKASCVCCRLVAA